MIPTETIEQVKARNSIVEVIGALIKLKKKGADHIGLCPFHNEKTPSFAVSQAKGIYKCFGCGKSGDVISFVMEHQNVAYPDAVKWLADRASIALEDTATRKKEYVKPVARLEKINQKAIEWFESRGISNNTLLRMNITESMEWMTQFEREVLTVCFNYFRNGELVNIKFRGPQKSFKLAKDAELIFYNLDALKGESEAVIVEGEMDCLTGVECGIYNIVSVPNGAGTGNQKLEYLDNCYQFFEGIEKIILATDNDAPGRALREELCRRLGVERCYQVVMPEGCKDLNDVKIKHGKDTVIHVLQNAKPWPIAGLLPMDDMYDTICDWYENGYPPGAKTRIPGFDHLLTFAPGQMTVITGIPGHGKDEFSNWLMTSLAKHENWPWGICGFEETPPETVTKLQEKIVGKAFGFRKNLSDRISHKEFGYSIGFVDSFFHIINPDDEAIDANLDSILNLFTRLVKQKGIKGAYINPWNWLEHQRQGNMTETEYVSVALTKIIRWARRYQVHVFLLAHTTKIGKEKDGKFALPNLYNINGSANFFNKTHNGITVYRDYAKGVTDIYVQKVKQSWYGQLGFSTYRYNTMTRQYEFDSTSIPEPTDGKETLPPGNWKQVDLDLGTEPDEQPFT